MEFPRSLARADFLALMPELILCATMLLVLLYDMALRLERSHRSGLLALAGILAALATASGSPPGLAFFGMVEVDSLTVLFRWIILCSAAVVVVLTMTSHEFWRVRAGEFYALLLCATAGACLLVASRNWVMFLLGLETLSLSSYVLAGYRKGMRQAAEAALKYMLFGSVATGVMIYGVSLFYGITGTLSFDGLAELSAQNRPAAALAGVLVLTGLAFKIGAAPLHFWAPDVYQGATAPAAAFLATLSKAAGIGALLRLFPGAILLSPAAEAGLRSDIAHACWMLAMLSMILGNLAALRQTDIKRLLAYSSIGHAGYLLIPLAASSGNPAPVISFYVIVYLIATMGVFAATVMIHNRTATYEYAAWQGLAKRSPVVVVALGVLLLSLVGLPPTAGFVGKWMLFSSAAGAAQESAVPAFAYVLVLTAVLASVVSLAYYIRIIKPMVFEDLGSEAVAFRVGPLERAAVLAFAVPVIAIQLQWQPVHDAVAGALQPRGAEPVRALSVSGLDDAGQVP